jgi:hypothetical protein
MKSRFQADGRRKPRLGALGPSTPTGTAPRCLGKSRFRADGDKPTVGIDRSVVSVGILGIRVERAPHFK